MPSICGGAASSASAKTRNGLQREAARLPRSASRWMCSTHLPYVFHCRFLLPATRQAVHRSRDSGMRSLVVNPRNVRETLLLLLQSSPTCTKPHQPSLPLGVRRLGRERRRLSISRGGKTSLPVLMQTFIRACGRPIPQCCTVSVIRTSRSRTCSVASARNGHRSLGVMPSIT